MQVRRFMEPAGEPGEDRPQAGSDGSRRLLLSLLQLTGADYVARTIADPHRRREKLSTGALLRGVLFDRGSVTVPGYHDRVNR